VEQGAYIIEIKGDKFNFTYKLDNILSLLSAQHCLSIAEIYVNELVTYPDLYKTLNSILTVKNTFNAKLHMFLHDYFCVCPSIFLLDTDNMFCNIPESTVCNRCFKESHFDVQHCSINEWRMNWRKFLDHCDEIIAFSKSSKDILQKAFPELNSQVIIKPHKVEYIGKINHSVQKTHKTINIGLLGDIGPHKGSRIIEEMIKQINAEELEVRIILIGSSHGNISTGKGYQETGRYKQRDIETLTIQNEIDIFFISSVCPETFSYTTEEVIQMDMPVACFNIGAPAERVACYGKGLIINEISGRSALTEIMNFMNYPKDITKGGDKKW